MRAASGESPVRLGLRANIGQLSLLVGVNALVGGTAVQTFVVDDGALKAA